MAVVRGSRRRLRMENSTRLVLSGMPRQIRKAPGMPMAYTCSRRPPVAYDAQSLQQVPVHARGLQELHLAKRRTGRLSRKEFATQRAGVRHWYGMHSCCNATKGACTVLPRVRHDTGKGVMPPPLAGCPEGAPQSGGCPGSTAAACPAAKSHAPTQPAPPPQALPSGAGAGLHRTRPGGSMALAGTAACDLTPAPCVWSGGLSSSAGASVEFSRIVFEGEPQVRSVNTGAPAGRGCRSRCRCRCGSRRRC